MVAFEEVGHFVDDDVLQALGRFFSQFQVEPDAPGRDVAGAPAGAHPPDAPSGHADTHDGLPFGDQRRDDFLQQVAIPGQQQGFPLQPVRAGPDAHFEDAVVAQSELRRPGLFDDLQPVVPPPDVVAFAVDQSALGLAGLLLKAGLLFPNPAQPRNDCQAYRFIGNPYGHSNPHPPIGRVYCQMQVFDVLANHLHRQALDF